LDCQKENKLHVLFVNKLPSNPQAAVLAEVHASKRALISRNHSATHLMHSALRQVLGDHVAQKGSLVNEKALRFDFNHFAKVEDEQLKEIEQIVNTKIKEHIPLEEQRDIAIVDAQEMGATALFGEKYGDTVRVITFDKNYSMELCGGTHVPNTKDIGLFKFISEGSVASGVRRVEAVCSEAAIALLNKAYEENEAIAGLLNNPKDKAQAIEKLLNESQKLRQSMIQMETQIIAGIKQELLNKAEQKNGCNRVIAQVSLPSAEAAKTLCFQLKKEIDHLACVLAYEVDAKPGIAILFDEKVLKSKDWKAGALVREWGQYIKGGGGGQDFFATAGGKEVAGLPKVVEAAKQFIS
jgi:alanyl-tRNA synthetase